jgi:hypothetical protein
MTPPTLPVVRRRPSSWLPGFVVGVAAGFATLEIPTLGWLLVVAFVVPVLIRGPRRAAIGGLLTALGGVWAVLLGRVALTCRAGCEAPDLGPWLAVGGVMLAAGVLLTVLARATSSD